MLTAYIDDSKTTDSAFVLAGFIATAESWARFSDDWQAVLDLKPPIEVFKMRVAHGRWSEQQWSERLLLFYNVIQDHVSAGVSLVIPYEPYLKVFKGIKLAENPYNCAFVEIMAMVAANQDKLGLTEPVDFIFDEGDDERIADAWKGFKEMAPRHIQKFIGQRPQFGDDKVMKPLQASDMHAWWRRRNFEMRMNPNLKTRAPPWPKHSKSLYMHKEWTEEDVKRAYDGLVAMAAKRASGK